MKRLVALIALLLVSGTQASEYEDWLAYLGQQYPSHFTVGTWEQNEMVIHAQYLQTQAAAGNAEAAGWLVMPDHGLRWCIREVNAYRARLNASIVPFKVYEPTSSPSRSALVIQTVPGQWMILGH